MSLYIAKKNGSSTIHLTSDIRNEFELSNGSVYPTTIFSTNSVFIPTEYEEYLTSSATANELQNYYYEEGMYAIKIPFSSSFISLEDIGNGSIFVYLCNPVQEDYRAEIVYSNEHSTTDFFIILRDLTDWYPVDMNIISESTILLVKPSFKVTPDFDSSREIIISNDTLKVNGYDFLTKQLCVYGDSLTNAHNLLPYSEKFTVPTSAGGVETIDILFTVKNSYKGVVTAGPLYNNITSTSVTTTLNNKVVFSSSILPYYKFSTQTGNNVSDFAEESSDFTYTINVGDRAGTLVVLSDLRLAPLNRDSVSYGLKNTIHFIGKDFSTIDTFIDYNGYGSYIISFKYESPNIVFSIWNENGDYSDGVTISFENVLFYF